MDSPVFSVVVLSLLFLLLFLFRNVHVDHLVFGVARRTPCLWEKKHGKNNECIIVIFIGSLVYYKAPMYFVTNNSIFREVRSAILAINKSPADWGRGWRENGIF